MSDVAEIFAPLIPAIIVGGLILGFRNCIDSIYLFGDGTQSLVQISQFWAGTDKFLWLIGESVFHLGIPVGICWAVQKKMGGTPMLGIVLGLTLVSSQLANAYAVPGLEAEGWPDAYVWNFGFTSVKMIGYQAQVLPAILAAFTLAYLERFFRRVIPQVISMIFVPLFSLVLAVMAAHFILGPVGWHIGTWISAGVQAGITGPFRIVFGAIFGFVYAPLVITGLHHMTNAVDLQLIADTATHGTMLWPLIALSNIAQGSAVVAMSVIQRKNTRAREVNIPSWISCYLGVTEPAMFGVNLKYNFPFICAMIGSSCAAMLSVALGCEASAIGVGGLPGILSMKPYSMLPFLLCMAVALVVPFLLTLIIGRSRFDKAGNYIEKTDPLPADQLAEDEEFISPMDGVTIPLKDIEDKVFSSGVMGDGFAIDIDQGPVIAPWSGTVLVVADTGHAVGLRADNGHEVLIHIGMDTVELGGKCFKIHVKQGEHVNQGDLLVEADIEYIKKAGKSTVSPIILTDQTHCVLKKPSQHVALGEEGILNVEGF